MSNIIVTSSGFNTINNYVSKENVELFKKICKYKKVLIIGNAAAFGTSNYIARDNVKENFLSAGAIKADIIDLNKSNLDLILDYDIIYVLGGNLTPLIELNKEYNLKNNIVDFLKKGIYIGESAGAVFLSDDVRYYYDIKKGTKPKYNVKLDTYKGLGLIDIYVYPHFQKTNQEMKDKIMKYEQNYNIEIVKLNDGEIITFDF